MGSSGMEGISLGDRLKCRGEPRDHTYILSFESLQLIWSHKQLEPILLENNWLPVSLCKYECSAWREYHYYKPKFSPLEKDIVLKRVRLPEPIEDAPKKDVLKLVRSVNEMAKRNILCAWVHKGPKISPCTPSTKCKMWSSCRRSIKRCS